MTGSSHASSTTDTGTPWGKLMVLIPMIGGAFAWLVSNFAEVRPVLEHPFTVFVWTAMSFLLGGASVYTLIVRPLEQRFQRAEDVIRKLREQERELLRLDGEKSAKIAALETSVAFLKEEIDDLKQRMNYGGPRKRPRAPKSTP